jgi:hypothetical protein
MGLSSVPELVLLLAEFLQAVASQGRLQSCRRDWSSTHFSKNFKTLKTGGLLEIGRHGTRLGTFGQKIGLGSDLYRTRGVSRVYLVASPKAMSRVDD